MKPYLPYHSKKIGIILVILAIIMSLIANLDDFCLGFIEGYNNGVWPNTDKVIEAKDVNYIPNELSKSLIWISLVFSLSGFICYLFSKEKSEDEMIQQLRYQSLVKSLLITWIIIGIQILANTEHQFKGLYILQLQLFLYVVIYNYYKKWKYK